MSELARRYAQALWQVSPDGEALERTARALMEEPALWEALCSPAVQAGEKGRVLARLPGLEEGGPLPHFYRLLAEKGRMALLPEIVEAFHGLELARRGLFIVGALALLVSAGALLLPEKAASVREKDGWTARFGRFGLFGVLFCAAAAILLVAGVLDGWMYSAFV